jgi:hypothetical protein
MIVKAKKVSNGFFIPMVEGLQHIKNKQILIKIDIIDGQIDQMEARHKSGYLNYPVQSDEFSSWESEQVWGD